MRTMRHATSAPTQRYWKRLSRGRKLRAATQCGHWSGHVLPHTGNACTCQIGLGGLSANAWPMQERTWDTNAGANLGRGRSEAGVGKVQECMTPPEGNSASHQLCSMWIHHPLHVILNQPFQTPIVTRTHESHPPPSPLSSSGGN